MAFVSGDHCISGGRVASNDVMLTMPMVEVGAGWTTVKRGQPEMPASRLSWPSSSTDCTVHRISPVQALESGSGT